jgi:hypothetical protein
MIMVKWTAREIAANDDADAEGLPSIKSLAEHLQRDLKAGKFQRFELTNEARFWADIITRTSSGELAPTELPEAFQAMLSQLQNALVQPMRVRGPR